MIRVIPKDVKKVKVIRANVNNMSRSNEHEAMFIQIFNERREKIQNYIITTSQWELMKELIDSEKLTPMAALIKSKETISEEDLKFLNTIAKILSIWDLINIKPRGFKEKIFKKENTLKDIKIHRKEDSLKLKYEFTDLIKYLGRNKEVENE